MIRIHHAKRARSARVIWLLEELSIPYELQTFEFTYDYLRSPEYRELHPLGQVPVVFDDDVKMIESGAIVEYLLEKYGGGRLAPAPGTRARAEYLQWFHYGEATLARYVSDIVRHRFGLPEAERQPIVVEDARKRLADSIAFVERTLDGRAFIAGDEFSAADIMVSYGLVMAKITRELPAGTEHIGKYLSRLKERPAYQCAWA